MSLHFFSLLYESFVDMTQNQASIIVLILLTLISLLLILALFFPIVKKYLTSCNVLEKHETPLSLLSWIIIIVLTVQIVKTFVVQQFIVEGGSMLYTFHDKDVLLVDKISYFFTTPSRGDVVIFKLIEDRGNGKEERYLIKRLLGLPGEKVSVSHGITTIYNKEHPQGFTIEEPFVEEKDENKNIDIQLSNSEYFVMGDNRKKSYDSRYWGPLDKEHMRGRVYIRLYPFKNIGKDPGGHSYIQ